MDWLARAGQATRAWQAYREFVARLRDELGLEPGAEIKALNESIGGGATALAVTSPTLRTPEDGFVGRIVEMRRIAALLSDNECRLLCMTGPGGVGKTRLARHALDELAPGYADGAVFVPLDDLSSPNEVGGRIANELEIDLKGRAEPIEQVIEALRSRKMLMVLDNFEQLVDGARLLEPLLSRCPGVKLIVTSRVRLSLPMEWLLPLEGLPCPEDEDRDRIEAFDAARLFVRAARRVHPELVATAEASGNRRHLPAGRGSAAGARTGRVVDTRAVLRCHCRRVTTGHRAAACRRCDTAGTACQHGGRVRSLVAPAE